MMGAAAMRKLRPRQVVPVDVMKLDPAARAEIEELRRHEAFDVVVCNHFDRYCLQRQVYMRDVTRRFQNHELAFDMVRGVVEPIVFKFT